MQTVEAAFAERAAAKVIADVARVLKDKLEASRLTEEQLRDIGADR